jgi:SAM-dependent methyltransferase
MASFKLHALLRRSPFVRWIVELKTRINHCRWKFLAADRQTLSAYAKRQLILDTLTTCNLRTVLETGTFLGDTTHFLSSRGYRVVTVEIDPRLAAMARIRFHNVDNIQIIEGDSGSLLPGLIAKLGEPALFYLDGHYSGGGTGKGEQETPVVKEVAAILADAQRGSFVIIDDARCFGLLPDYPPLAEFLKMLRDRGIGNAIVKDDTIRFSVERKN